MRPHSLSRRMGCVLGILHRSHTVFDTCTDRAPRRAKWRHSLFVLFVTSHASIQMRATQFNPYLHERVNARHSLSVLHFWQRLLLWPSTSIGRMSIGYVNLVSKKYYEPWRSETFEIHLSIAEEFFSALSIEPTTSSYQQQQQHLYISLFWVQYQQRQIRTELHTSRLNDVLFCALNCIIKIWASVCDDAGSSKCSIPSKNHVHTNTNKHTKR